MTPAPPLPLLFFSQRKGRHNTNTRRPSYPVVRTNCIAVSISVIIVLAKPKKVESRSSNGRPKPEKKGALQLIFQQSSGAPY